MQNKVIAEKFDKIKRYPVETYISSDGKAWYTIYNDGWKECGGVISTNSTTSGEANVTATFPIKFSNTNYYANASGNNYFQFTGVWGESTQSANFRFFPATGTWTLTLVRWEVKGY